MEQHILPLSALKAGERAAVVRLGASGSIRRRLLDMGLTEGARVECLHRSPWGTPPPTPSEARWWPSGTATAHASP